MNVLSARRAIQSCLLCQSRTHRYPRTLAAITSNSPQSAPTRGRVSSVRAMIEMAAIPTITTHLKTASSETFNPLPTASGDIDRRVDDDPHQRDVRLGAKFTLFKPNPFRLNPVISGLTGSQPAHEWRTPQHIGDEERPTPGIFLDGFLGKVGL